MFDIGFFELLVILTIGLVVLGPERLPGAIRKLLSTYRQFRNTAETYKADIEHQLRVHELHENLKKAEQQGLTRISPELQASIDELKRSAAEVNEPYRGQQKVKSAGQKSQNAKTEHTASSGIDLGQGPHQQAGSNTIHQTTHSSPAGSTAETEADKAKPHGT